MLHASAVHCGPAGILLSPFVTRNGRLPPLSNSTERRLSVRQRGGHCAAMLSLNGSVMSNSSGRAPIIQPEYGTQDVRRLDPRPLF